MNHGFVQGNKRTAYAIAEWLLWQNQLGMITTSDDQIVEMCLATENQKWTVDQVDAWLRSHIEPKTKA